MKTNKLIATIMFIGVLGMGNAQNTSCLGFDGTNDYVRYLDDVTLGRMDAAANYTIEAWVKIPVGAPTGGRIVQRFSLFTLYYDTSNNKLSFGVDKTDGSGWAYYHSNNNTLPDDDTWHHVAAIRDASGGTFKLYIDGVNVSSGSWSGWALRNESSRNLYVGNDGGGGNYFGGKIDEIRIQNVATPLASLHSSVGDAPYTSDGNTAALFHFDENATSVTANEAAGIDARLGDSAIGDTKEPAWASVAGLPLPIVLTTFNVGITSHTIELHWQTATETNNQGFEIQKSTNAKDWSKIGWEEGNGNSFEPQLYHFTDKTPALGINYYRLKQTDWGKDIHYSTIISAHFGKTASFAVSPNPTTDFVYFEKDHFSKEGQEIKVFNSRGELVFQTDLKDGQIDIHHLPKGIYYLITNENGKNLTCKLIKQ